MFVPFPRLPAELIASVPAFRLMAPLNVLAPASVRVLPEPPLRVRLYPLPPSLMTPASVSEPPASDSVPLAASTILLLMICRLALLFVIPPRRVNALPMLVKAFAPLL